MSDNRGHNFDDFTLTIHFEIGSNQKYCLAAPKTLKMSSNTSFQINTSQMCYTATEQPNLAWMTVDQLTSSCSHIICSPMNLSSTIFVLC